MSSSEDHASDFQVIRPETESMFSGCGALVVNDTNRQVNVFLTDTVAHLWTPLITKVQDRRGNSPVAGWSCICISIENGAYLRAALPYQSPWQRARRWWMSLRSRLTSTLRLWSTETDEHSWHHRQLFRVSSSCWETWVTGFRQTWVSVSFSVVVNYFTPQTDISNLIAKEMLCLLLVPISHFLWCSSTVECFKPTYVRIWLYF